MTSKVKVQQAVKIIGANGFVDKIQYKRGTDTYKFGNGYYYSFGKTTEKFAAKVMMLFPQGSVELVNSSNEFRIWPATSYFMAEIKIKDEDAVVKVAEALTESVKETWQEMVAEANICSADSGIRF